MHHNALRCNAQNIGPLHAGTCTHHTVHRSWPKAQRHMHCTEPNKARLQNVAWQACKSAQQTHITGSKGKRQGSNPCTQDAHGSQQQGAAHAAVVQVPATAVQLLTCTKAPDNVVLHCKGIDTTAQPQSPCKHRCPQP